MFKYAILFFAIISTASATLGINVENLSLHVGDSGGPQLAQAGYVTGDTLVEVGGLSWHCNPMHNHGDVLTEIGSPTWVNNKWKVNVYLGVENATQDDDSTCALKKDGNVLDTVTLDWIIEE